LLAIILTSISSYDANAGRSREFSNNQNVYITEWSKLLHRAELGDPDALFSLGNFYFKPPKGSNFRRNYKKAGDFYFQASLRNNASAQYNIALMLHNGFGFKKNIIESYVWFYLASTNDSPVAKSINRKTAQIAQQLKADFNQEQLIEAELKIKQYQKIIKSKRYREARLPEQT
jgi:TPR repeat protein